MRGGCPGKRGLDAGCRDAYAVVHIPDHPVIRRGVGGRLCKRGGAVGVCGLKDEQVLLVGLSWLAQRLQFWLAHLTHCAS